MRVEELKRRVVLQRHAVTLNALNESVGGWVNVLAGDGKVWAALNDVTGRQFVAAGGKQNEVTTTITIRKREGVDASMRVLHGDVVYDITAVLQRRDHFMDLICTRGTNNG